MNEYVAMHGVKIIKSHYISKMSIQDEREWISYQNSTPNQ